MKSYTHVRKRFNHDQITWTAPPCPLRGWDNMKWKYDTEVQYSQNSSQRFVMMIRVSFRNVKFFFSFFLNNNVKLKLNITKSVPCQVWKSFIALALFSDFLGILKVFSRLGGSHGNVRGQPTLQMITSRSLACCEGGRWCRKPSYFT